MTQQQSDADIQENQTLTQPFNINKELVIRIGCCTKKLCTQQGRKNMQTYTAANVFEVSSAAIQMAECSSIFSVLTLACMFSHASVYRMLQRNHQLCRQVSPIHTQNFPESHPLLNTLVLKFCDYSSLADFTLEGSPSMSKNFCKVSWS